MEGEKCKESICCWYKQHKKVMFVRTTLGETFEYLIYLQKEVTLVFGNGTT